MKKLYITLICIIATLNCHAQTDKANLAFTQFEDSFLDAYWSEYPSGAIINGYGKYYEKLIIPNSESFSHRIDFSKQWLETLSRLDFNALTNNNQITFKIIKNQLESDIWYTETFKPQQWDASLYNISYECDYIIGQPYAPLDERLKILSKHLEHTDDYYKAALVTLTNPTKEHLKLSMTQHLGGLSVFGSSLTDSINKSHLAKAEIALLQKNIAKTTKAINDFVVALKAMESDKNRKFRDYRIGKALFAEKFKYDLATNFTPEEVYLKAQADKLVNLAKMKKTANALWPKYYPSQARPKDSLEMVQLVLDKIQLQHETPAGFYKSLVNQVHQLKKYIIEKDLFDFDTVSPPIKVRIMPAYAAGFAVASAEFTPAYQKKGTTYYNIEDLTTYTSEKAEGVLREYNSYSSQYLSIHEAVPGHCLQGIYANKKSPDVVRSVFYNGAMIEGWAVYTEHMMLENGWGNHAPEMELIRYKFNLRVIANVIIDYELHCLNKSQEDLIRLMVKDCFQTTAQAEEKYHRATVSQVQLCSYYSGFIAIASLREEYKKKLGDQYRLKNFHEKFLSYGSSPVKYIREQMMGN